MIANSCSIFYLGRGRIPASAGRPVTPGAWDCFVEEHREKKESSNLGCGHYYKQANSVCQKIHEFGSPP